MGWGDGLKKKQGNMEELNSQEEYLDPKMGVPMELEGVSRSREEQSPGKENLGEGRS